MIDIMKRAVNEAQLRKELFEILSGEALWLRCKVDNAPALSARQEVLFQASTTGHRIHQRVDRGRRQAN